MNNELSPTVQRLPAWTYEEPGESPLPESRVIPHDYPLDLLTRVMHGNGDDEDGEIGLTITSNGQVISGLAISAAKWAGLLAQSLVDAGQQPIGDLVGQLMTEQVDLGRKINEARSEKDVSRLVPRYLHFREVTVRTGSEALRMPLWRVELKSVNGWNLGNEAYPDSVAFADLTYKKYEVK